MSSQLISKYRYTGAGSLVLLHEQHLLSCINKWREAKRLNIRLPKTDDSDYKTLETLLRHILRSSRGYMTWICEKLKLPNPQIEKTPEVELIETELKLYVSHLLEKWRLPLVDIPENRFHSPTYSSRWEVDYCIDAMLEHAVMHPIRHEFQLHNLIKSRQNK